MVDDTNSPPLQRKEQSFWNGSDNETNYQKIGFTNDFMFCSLMEDAKLCKGFLERVLDIEITELQYIERQKDIRVGYDTKGIRLDVYVRDSKGNAYDIEMQTTSISDMAKRCRYYYSEMDSYQIRKGAKYNELKKSIVIFVCTFDAFGSDRSLYTFRTMCEEEPAIHFDDKKLTVILNAKGKREGIPQNLSKLLDYISTNQIADDFTKEIEERVEKLRNDKDWRDRYMTLEMKFDEKREEGRTEGRIEGRTEGHEEKLVQLVCKKLAKQKTVHQIADDLEEEVEVIQRICDVAKEFAPEYDAQAVFEEIKQRK